MKIHIEGTGEEITRQLSFYCEKFDYCLMNDIRITQSENDSNYWCLDMKITSMYNIDINDEDLKKFESDYYLKKHI